MLNLPFPAEQPVEALAPVAKPIEKATEAPALDPIRALPAPEFTAKAAAEQVDPIVADNFAILSDLRLDPAETARLRRQAEDEFGQIDWINADPPFSRT